MQPLSSAVNHIHWTSDSMSPGRMERNGDPHCQDTSNTTMDKHKTQVIFHDTYRLHCLLKLVFCCATAKKLLLLLCLYAFFLPRHWQHLYIEPVENPVTSSTVHQLFPPFRPHPTPNLVRRGRILITKTGPALQDINILVSSASAP